jgi:hypothetical protein
MTKTKAHLGVPSVDGQRSAHCRVGHGDQGRAERLKAMIVECWVKSRSKSMKQRVRSRGCRLFLVGLVWAAKGE